MSKSDKWAKKPSVKDVRRTPASPDRATPSPGPRPEKPHGYSYVWTSWMMYRGGERHFKWFKSTGARDQSLASELRRKEAFEARGLRRVPGGERMEYFMQDFRKEER